MSALNYPQVDLIEFQLQQILSYYQKHFFLADCEATLEIAKPSHEQDLELAICWRGIPLRLFCNGAALGRWFESHLQGADFSSLPPLLQLALIDQESKIQPGVIVNKLEPISTGPFSIYLSITLHRGEERLILWLEGNPKSLLRQLPARPLAELNAIKLRLSLQYGSLQIDQIELRKLNTGDLFLLPPGDKACEKLQCFIEDQLWAYFHQRDNQLELTTMHDSDATEPTNSLSNLDQLQVQISFEVGRKMIDLHTLATLNPGSLIDLATPLNGEIRILANQSCIAIGELVNIQERLGVRVQRLLVDSPS